MEYELDLEALAANLRVPSNITVTIADPGTGWVGITVSNGRRTRSCMALLPFNDGVRAPIALQHHVNATIGMCGPIAQPDTPDSK